jgi:hypothetical protein
MSRGSGTGLLFGPLIERRPHWHAQLLDRQGCDTDDRAVRDRSATLLRVTDEPIMVNFGLLRHG